MKAIIFDTETTGLRLPSLAQPKQQPRIIEFGAVVVHNGEIVTMYNQLINPECEISPEITKITGITQEMIEGKPTFRQVLLDIEALFSNAPDYGIAHNMPFDEGMLAHELTVIGRNGFPFPKVMMCTAQEYTPEFGRRPSLKSLYEHVIGMPLVQTHRALDDAMALYEILLKEEFFV